MISGKNENKNENKDKKLVHGLKIPNAYAVAGGNLYFTTGLLDMTESNAELESVLAHEIAHVERRHTLRGYKEYLKKQQLLKGVAALTSIA